MVKALAPYVRTDENVKTSICEVAKRGDESDLVLLAIIDVLKSNTDLDGVPDALAALSLHPQVGYWAQEALTGNTLTR